MLNDQCSDCGGPATAGITAKRNADGTKRTGRRCVACAAIASVAFSPQPERRLPAPAALQESPAWAVAKEHSPDGTLWRHQSLGLEALDAGDNLAVATATASGKSLVFQTWTLHQLSSDPGSRTAVFYPTKALANDQHRRWGDACRSTGIDPEVVQTISGDVPMAQRENTLRRARIVLMTPDVCHAWLLRRSKSPGVAQFLASLRTVVIDEAHTYEDVFGSNAAYLFRRLTSAALAAGAPAPPQFIAATATILDPAEHMARLTGQHFTVVADDQNGSPRHTRQVVHLTPDFATGGNEQNLAALVTLILNQDPDAQIIAFADSRQGVERVARQINRDDVLAYRGGYRPEDRRKIEERLQKNTIRGVIATSALELGIDMSDLNYGINLDLPQTRKQLLQRIGRIGRSQPGTFIILAQEGRFTDHGDSLENYLKSQVEPSYLYLDNKYVAYQQALCLAAETNGRLAGGDGPPPGCSWPETFAEALKLAASGPTEDLADIHRRGTRQPPHIAYSMRNSGEEILEIKLADDDGERTLLETITVNTAIREAYPGARYNHQRKPFSVVRWGRSRRDSNAAFVEVREADSGSGRTKALIRHTAVTAADEDDGASHRRHGLVARVNATVTESVEGYHDVDGRLNEYRDLQEKDPNRSRKEREFPTTGVLVQIRQDWFTGRFGDAWHNRRQIAQALKGQLAYRRSIAQGDIGIVTENLFLRTPAGHKLSGNTIMLYDNVYGGLALTEDLWQNLAEYAVQLQKAAQERSQRESRPGERRQTRLEPQVAASFLAWLSPANDQGEDAPETSDPTDWWRIYRPGTAVLVSDRQGGPDEEGSVSEPRWQDGVRYLVSTGEQEVTLAESELAPSGPRPDWMLWQPSSGSTEELDSVLES